MPLFEMPLSELRTYKGRNPKPKDFDAYWDRALRELDATPPAPELVPHASPANFAECFDLCFTGVGGARIHAKYLRPTSERPASRRPEVPRLLRQQRRLVRQAPLGGPGPGRRGAGLRGQGGSSEDVGGVKGTTLHGQIVRGLSDHPDKLLFRQIFLDTAQLARVVDAFPEVDAARVGATGGSQGGGLTLACAALEPRITRAAPVFPFLCDYQRVWEMDLAENAYEELKDILPPLRPAARARGRDLHPARLHRRPAPGGPHPRRAC